MADPIDNNVTPPAEGTTTPPTTPVTPTELTEEQVKSWLTAKNKEMVDSKHLTKINGECESKRIANKSLDNALREILGVDATVDLSDTALVAKNFKEALAKERADAQASISSTLIKAEFKALENQYDIKLVDKLLDKSKITVENGEVKGLTEAITELEKEFPVIKKTTPGASGFNPANHVPDGVDISKLPTDQYMIEWNKKHNIK